MSRELSTLSRGLGALLAGLFLGACGEDPIVTYVQPVYEEPCLFMECGVGTCSPDESGEPSCLCPPGYRGVSCDLCEAGYHRDHGGMCAPDVRCVDQEVDPCAPFGECDDSSGAVICMCEEGYEGPRCSLCADRYGRDALGRCLPIFLGAGTGGGSGTGGSLGSSGDGGGGGTGGVAGSGGSGGSGSGAGGSTDEPIEPCDEFDMEYVSFEGATDFAKEANTCASRAELWAPRLTLRSRAGAEPIMLCASNTYSGLTSQHVEMRAGRATAGAPSEPGELVFWEPVVMVGFDYAATLKPVTIDVFADDVMVGSLAIPALSKATFSTQLDSPTTHVDLVSRDGSLQAFGLDNVVFTYESCR